MPTYYGRLVVFEHYRVEADSPEAAMARMVERPRSWRTTRDLVGWELFATDPQGEPSAVLLDHGYSPTAIETVLDNPEVTTGECLDCHRKIYFRQADESYHHLTDPARGCFLIPAEEV